MKETEPKRRKRELTESEFRLALNFAVKNRGDDDIVLEIVNEMLQDIERYRASDFRVRFWSRGDQLWLEPELKGEIGFKQKGKRKRI